jgi:predicted ester cyclase
VASGKRSARQVAIAYFEAIDRRDLDAMVDMWHPDGHGEIHGLVRLTIPHELRSWFSNLFTAFPDFSMTVLDLVAYGDRAAVRWRVDGSFTGPTRFEGLTPTGAEVTMEGLDLLTITDGLIRENNAYTNGADLARQLGALPPADSVGERLMLGAVNARTAALELGRRALARD